MWIVALIFSKVAVNKNLLISGKLNMLEKLYLWL